MTTGTPRTTPANALALSVAEFALISAISEADPLVRIDGPVLDSLGAAAALDGLRARGIVVREEDGDHLAAPLRPLLGVALHADRAICVSSSEVLDEHEVTLAIAAEVAVELHRAEGEVLLLAPKDPALAVESTLALLALPAATAGVSAVDGVEDVSLERYFEVLDDSGDPAPGGSALAAVGAAVISRAPLRRLELRHAGGIWRALTFYALEDGLVVVERADDASGVTLLRLSADAAATLVAERVAAFRADAS